ncbi:hypothetical protein B0H13DRAFT_1893292 [Mycena leptocephala]|nr:hypothetical protein B0H13DRAFT_1893292 [Mycena leptocephala]
MAEWRIRRKHHCSVLSRRIWGIFDKQGRKLTSRLEGCGHVIVMRETLNYEIGIVLRRLTAIQGMTGIFPYYHQSFPGNRHTRLPLRPSSPLATIQIAPFPVVSPKPRESQLVLYQQWFYMYLADESREALGISTEWCCDLDHPNNPERKFDKRTFFPGRFIYAGEMNAIYAGAVDEPDREEEEGQRTPEWQAYSARSPMESDVFGLQKWLAPARIGLFRAWAWILVASHAHARHFGLQAILSAWQAIPPQSK